MTNPQNPNNADRPMTLDELAKQAERGVSIIATGRAFNPNLHPRGKDGKFIEKFGFVKFVLDGKAMRGQVVDISERNIGAGRKIPKLTVRVDGKSGKRRDVSFVDIDPKTVTQAPPDKARLDGKLTVADLDNALEWDGRYATGWGYNGVRNRFERDANESPEIAQEIAAKKFDADDVDSIVISRMNESGMSYESMAEWLNSRDARFFSDEVAGAQTKADVEKILDRYLPKPGQAKPTTKKKLTDKQMDLDKYNKDRKAALDESMAQQGRINKATAPRNMGDARADAAKNDGFSRQAEIDAIWQKYAGGPDDYGRSMTPEDRGQLIALLETKQAEVGLGGMSDQADLATLKRFQRLYPDGPAGPAGGDKISVVPTIGPGAWRAEQARVWPKTRFSRQDEIDELWTNYEKRVKHDDYGYNMTPEEQDKLIELLEAKQAEVGLGGASDSEDYRVAKRAQAVRNGTLDEYIANLSDDEKNIEYSRRVSRQITDLQRKGGSHAKKKQAVVSAFLTNFTPEERADWLRLLNEKDAAVDLRGRDITHQIWLRSVNELTASAAGDPRVAELRARVRGPIVASLRARVHPPKAVVASAADELRARVHGPTAVTAATRPWNKNLHPRGKDGKFIEKLGFVKFASGVGRKQDKGKVIGVKKGKNDDGMILSIEKDDGTIVEKMPSEVSTTAAPKASISKKAPASSVPSTPSKKLSKGDKISLTKPQSAMGAVDGTERDTENQWKAGSKGTIVDDTGDYFTMRMNTSRNGTKELLVKKSDANSALTGVDAPSATKSTDKPAVNTNEPGAWRADQARQAGKNFSRQNEIDELWTNYEKRVKLDDYGKSMTPEEQDKLIELLEAKRDETGLGGASDDADLKIAKERQYQRLNSPEESPKNDANGGGGDDDIVAKNIDDVKSAFVIAEKTADIKRMAFEGEYNDGMDSYDDEENDIYGRLYEAHESGALDSNPEFKDLVWSAIGAMDSALYGDEEEVNNVVYSVSDYYDQVDRFLAMKRGASDSSDAPGDAPDDTDPQGAVNAVEALGPINSGNIDEAKTLADKLEIFLDNGSFDVDLDMDDEDASEEDVMSMLDNLRADIADFEGGGGNKSELDRGPSKEQLERAQATTTLKIIDKPTELSDEAAPFLSRVADAFAVAEKIADERRMGFEDRDGGIDVPLDSDEEDLYGDLYNAYESGVFDSDPEFKEMVWQAIGDMDNAVNGDVNDVNDLLNGTAEIQDQVKLFKSRSR